LEKARDMTPWNDPEEEQGAYIDSEDVSRLAKTASEFRLTPVESEEVKRLREMGAAARKSGSKVILPSTPVFPGIREEMFSPPPVPNWITVEPWAPTKKVIDLAGGPLTPEMIKNAARDVQGKPDQDELIQAAYDMQAKVMEPAVNVSVHPRTMNRLQDEAVRRGQSVSLQAEEVMLPIGIRVVGDREMTPGAWKVVSEHHVYDSDRGLMHRYAGKCPQCAQTIEMVFPIESAESGRARRDEANKEHANFMERLRMKVRANYAQNKDIIRDFLFFAAKSGSRKELLSDLLLKNPSEIDGLIQEFLESFEPHK
jgi:hypothetical protein